MKQWNKEIFEKRIIKSSQLLLVLMVIVCWLSIKYFYNFYEKAVFFIDPDLSFIHKFIWLITYSSKEILGVTVMAIILQVTLGFLGHYYYLLAGKYEQGTRLIWASCLGLFILISLVLTLNLLWILGIFSTLVSCLLLYLWGVLCRKEEAVEFEVGEVVKVLGPYKLETDASDHIAYFKNEWTDYFAVRNFDIRMERQGTKDDYYIQAILENKESELVESTKVRKEH